MKKILLSAFVITVVIAVSFAGYVWGEKKVSPAPSQSAQKTITIVDSAGRKVEVPWPVRRVAALSGDVGMAIVALGAKDTIVGISMYAIGKPWAPNVTNIGSCFGPNIEAIIATNPDIVITYAPPTMWPPPEALEDKLEPLGIKVIRLNFYKIETLFAETKILGRLMNKEKRANELIKYWEKQLNLIKERVKKLKPQEQIRVYWETYGDYSAAGPGSGWHEELILAGGINVFSENPFPYPKVSPEVVIKKNPDVIIKTVSSIVFNPLGATDPTSLKQLRDAIMARPGWDAINAVKEGKVYITSTEYLHDAFGLIAEVGYVAKILYPDLFKDFNPDALLKYWLEDNLRIKFKGIWIYPSLG